MQYSKNTVLQLENVTPARTAWPWSLIRIFRIPPTIFFPVWLWDHEHRLTDLFGSSWVLKGLNPL